MQQVQADEPSMINRSLANRQWQRYRTEARAAWKVHTSRGSELNEAVASASATQPVIPPSEDTSGAIIPFFVHPTHTPFYAGGFVACTSCGCCDSQPNMREGLNISRPCRPDPEHIRVDSKGKRREKTKFTIVARLRKGIIPFGFKRWPDGTPIGESPRPILLQPTSDDVDSRLPVPTVHGATSTTCTTTF